ncbi:MAG TPA: SDR family oxidoreductase [Dehalococcoidia bacterium]|jgi:NAD(P)-dependent dehydrogenase (short-subunit alcohol dehydrogenase family)|nr:SDR family oxidoreductase [Dehalococcoidia bacterium]
MTSAKDYIPLSELISLGGKVAIVTGGAAGIGLAISHRLAEAGARLFIADADGDKAEQASRELEERGYQAGFRRCDVSSEAQVRDMVRAVVEEMGGVDILVNNAGIYPRMALAEMTAGDFDRVVAVNLRGTFLCSREVSQRMIEQGRGGSIINIASIDAIHPSTEGLYAYDASKGGVLTLTKSLARELGRHDIRVNVIAPGAIMTGGVRSLLGGAQANLGRAQLKAFLSRMPLGRLGEADDIARVVLFLASDLAGYMTGSLVVVDGGYLIT